jgi:hypothetical protein
MNTSQDPDYEGPVGKEKRIHQTHFGGVMERPTHPRDDPAWEPVGVGRWRRKRNDADAEASRQEGNG